LAIIVALFFLGNVGVAICWAYSRAVPGAFMLLYYIGIAWGFSWWVVSDSRERILPMFWDHGWFVFYAWPIFVPYHAVRTRGIRGCGLLLMLFGAFWASYLVAVALFYLIAP
jgi:hypothetical protein